MPNCSNMPHLLLKENYNNYSDFFKAICDEINNNIVGKTFRHRTIALQEPKNKKTIWHIISKTINNENKERAIDRSRAERITWIKQLLDDSSTCSHCNDYLVWAKHHIRAIRWCIYCPKDKYVIILEECGTNKLLLVTAFTVTPQKDIDFRREHDRYINFGI